MINFTSSGSFEKTIRFLTSASRGTYLTHLEEYGRAGVEALSKATPVDSGETANSWVYEIKRSRNGVSIIWKNTNEEKGVNVAVLIQYGHGTGTGGYVQGIDFINPALKPIFDKIAEEVWKKVTNV